jgi:hypothetical protein
MARRPKPLTVADHHELGKSFCRLRIELDGIFSVLNQHLPKLAEKWSKHREGLFVLRLAMEENLYEAMRREGVDNGDVAKCYLPKDCLGLGGCRLPNCPDKPE